MYGLPYGIVSRRHKQALRVLGDPLPLTPARKYAVENEHLARGVIRCLGDKSYYCISSSSDLSNFRSKPVDDALENNKLSSRNNLLVICGSQLSWKGDIEGLKDFTRDVLKMIGRWKSPGGEVKAFYDLNEEYEELVFKWQGLKRKKIEIVKDRKNELLKNLKSHACDENGVNNGKIFNDHVLYEAISLPLPLPSRTCSECGVDESHSDHTEIECKLIEVVSRLSRLVWRVITAKIKNKILYFFMLILLFTSCVMMLQF